MATQTEQALERKVLKSAISRLQLTPNISRVMKGDAPILALGIATYHVNYIIIMPNVYSNQ
ncbi:hypothetical protein SESBI_19285 [Sesbania bispinosa]|nr:hypothetical protein SESBI_19285 [Sesbania bispinosa]